MGMDELRDRATLTVEEAAELLGVGRSSAYEAARRGDIPAIRVGHRLVVSAPALLRLLEQPVTTTPDDSESREHGAEDTP